MTDDRIEPGRAGDYVDLDGLPHDEADHFLFLLRGSGLAYRSGPTGVEIELGHQDEIASMLDQAATPLDQGDGAEARADSLAGIAKRSLGYTVDWISVGLAGFFATVVALRMAGLSLVDTSDDPATTAERLLAMGVPVLVSCLMICFPTFRYGRTFGKRSAGTVVIDEETLGEISFVQSLVRWLVPVTPGLLAVTIVWQIPVSAAVSVAVWAASVAASILVYGWAWFDDYSRAVHDLLAGTLVVDDRSRKRHGRSFQLNLEQSLHRGPY